MLKKAALNIFVKTLNPKTLDHLKGEFQKIDQDYTGLIELQDLEKVIHNANLSMPKDEIRRIIGELDYNGTHLINYTEFLSATIHVQDFLTEERLQALFKQFDLDDSGMITASNIKEALAKLGKAISTSELDQIMKTHEVEGHHFINFDHFKSMMLQGGA